MEITYRKVDLKNPEEMQKIAAIDMTIPALFDSLFQVNEKTIAERLEQLMKSKDDDFFDLAVTAEGKIVGYHALNQFTTPHGLQAASIQTLWVDPEFRKQGIAKALKGRGEIWAKARELDHILTFVHCKNSSMLQLNEKCEYELVGYKMRKSLRS